MCGLFSIPKQILPEVKDTCSYFGALKKETIGLSYDFPISSMIGDAQSSLIGNGLNFKINLGVVKNLMIYATIFANCFLKVFVITALILLYLI